MKQLVYLRHSLVPSCKRERERERERECVQRTENKTKHHTNVILHDLVSHYLHIHHRHTQSGKSMIIKNYHWSKTLVVVKYPLSETPQGTPHSVIHKPHYSMVQYTVQW